MICKYCLKDMKDNDVCPYCGISSNKNNIKKEVDINSTLSEEEKEIKTFFRYFKKPIHFLKNIFFFSKYGLGTLVCSLFIIVGLFGLISNFVSIIGKEKTTGTLSSYYDCGQFGEEDNCLAYYEFKVDGKTYKSSSDEVCSKEDFPKNKTVYYNPKNPNDNSMDSNWGIFLAISILLFSLFVYEYNRINKNIKKLTD